MFEELIHNPDEGLDASGNNPGSSGLRLLQRAFAATQSGVMITDAMAPDDPIVFVNRAFERITGYASEEVLGRNPRFLQAGDDDQPVLDDLRANRRVNNDHIEWSGILQNYKKDGTSFWNELSAAAVRDETGCATHHVGFMTDVTARKQAEEELKESHELLRAVMEGTTDAVFVKDLQGRYLMINRAGAEALGKREEEVIGKNDIELFADEDGREVMGADQRILDAGETRTTEDTKTAGGRTRTFLSTKGPYRDGEGNVVGIFGVARDITDRKRSEEELRESEQRLQAVASGAPVITFALDSEGVFTYEKGAVLETLGLEPGQSIGYSVFEIYAQFPYVLENVRRALSGEKVVATVEIGDMAFHTIYTPQRDESGEVEGIIGVATDITERRRLEQELEYRSTHDSLTGLANRRLLFDRLSLALQYSSRHERSVSVLYLDLDNFKAVNDRHGHEVGDALLSAIAGRIERCLRPSDTAARVGGDEFIVLLEGLDPEKTGEVARRIEAAFESPFAIDEVEIRIGTSVGLAYTGMGTKDAAQLLREADRQMYRAKRKSGPVST